MEVYDNLMNAYVMFSDLLKPLVYKSLEMNFKVIVKEQTFLLKVPYYRIYYITALFRFAQERYQKYFFLRTSCSRLASLAFSSFSIGIRAVHFLTDCFGN